MQNNNSIITKDQLKTYLEGVGINDNASAKPVIDAMIAKGARIEGINDVSIGEKALNFVGNVAKDAANTLVVTPVSRATEAVTRTAFPNSMAAKGYEAYADENQPIDSGILGMQVAQPGNNFEQGARTVTSDAAKSASYLIPYGKIAGGVAGATGSNLAGQMAAFGTGGYLSDVGNNLPDQNQSVGEALTPGMGTAVGMAIPLGVAGAKVTGRATQAAGTGITEAVLPRNMQEAGIVQAYKANVPFLQRVASVLGGTSKGPQTLGKTATEQGIVGTKTGIGIQAKRAGNKLWNTFIQPALDKAGAKISLPEYFNTIERKIIESTPEKTRQNALLDALNAFREDYKGVDIIDLPYLQKLKEGWAEFVPEKFYKGQNIAGNARQVQALLADEARQTLYTILGPEARQAYLDYGNLKGLAKLGQVSMTGQKLEGGTGSLLSELKSQAVTPVGTLLGQVVYRTGQGLEFIGNAGAKTLDAALGLNSKVQDFKIPTNTETSQTAANTMNSVNNMADSVTQATEKASKSKKTK